MNKKIFLCTTFLGLAAVGGVGYVAFQNNTSGIEGCDFSSNFGFVDYTVQSGETLSDVAYKCYGDIIRTMPNPIRTGQAVTEWIASYNELENINRIKAGQIIKLSELSEERCMELTSMMDWRDIDIQNRQPQRPIPRPVN